MKIPFMPDNQSKIEQENLRQEANLIQKQQGLQSADQINDEVMLQYQQQREDLLRWQQDLDDETKQLIRDLRNEVSDDGGETWKSNGKPIVNELGIKKIVSDVRPFLSRNMINCNFSEERVLDLLKRSSNNLATDLCANRQSYDLEYSNISIVLRWVKNIKISGPHRAMNGWSKEIDSRISKRVETFSDGITAQPKKKLFGIF